MFRQILKWCGILLLSLILLILVAGFYGWSRLRASLPQLEGQARLPGLKAAVAVERDTLGVPTIKAANRSDAARATGFLHAQDRFFQMDLGRRYSAGELAELLGPGLVKADQQLRMHRFRRVAHEVVQSMPAEHRALLAAYVAGVNAGLASLKARPPEYFALRSQPQAWLMEDSILVALGMWLALAEPSGWDDSLQDALQKVLPAPAYQFFAPPGTEWDAALDDTTFPVPRVPTPEEFSFSRTNAPLSKASGFPEPEPEPALMGSNGWAVDGRHTRTGSALVANDMHLAQGVPGTWYRVRIVCSGTSTSPHDLAITGVTLPGVSAVVAGSNRHIAWALTAAYVDVTDVIPLELSPADPHLYRTPDGWKRFEEVREAIHVRGAADQESVTEWTIWGPVLPANKSTPKRALRYAAHLPEATNMQLSEMENLRDAASALDLAPRCGVPPLNFVVGDRAGTIGWTLAGPLPRRVGFEGRRPVSWADGTKRWDGWWEPSEYPRVLSPANGRLWSANHRQHGSPAYLSAYIGNSLDARAQQIRDRLLALPTATPADMLAIQLDDRAVFLARWQKLLLETLNQPSISNRADIGELRSLVESWSARAATNSAGYRFVRSFHDRAHSLLLEPITQRCREVFPDYSYGLACMEQPIWILLHQRPAHLLNPRFKTYDDLLVAAVEEMLSRYRKQNLKLSAATWGNHNRVTLRHPLSGAVPFLSRWLDMPTAELPGDNDMPRVQGPWPAGASERFAVSPGHEEEGIFHMPAGQSGHFLSPFYRAGHEAWVEGLPTPFLPGPARYRLDLVAQ